jgi:hypothetical protein
MPISDQPEPTAEESVVADAKPACVALVPLVQPAPWSRAPTPLSRPNSVFVTHLIATAARVPQTRALRRATPADARTAYGANRPAIQGAGVRTRHTI